ncbi:MAG: GFA family protein [Gammaproteobacteria bacterium]|nr:GFA family protein [Gammaproteobacteria bacterium]
MMARTLVTHTGGCHCGAVRLEVDAPRDLTVQECNCSICSRSGYLHLLVETEQFRLLQGKESLSTYTFNTGVAQHHFCRHCGIKSFYVPRSHPNGYSVNLRCIDSDSLGKITVQTFDGRNWEANVAELRRARTGQNNE